MRACTGGANGVVTQHPVDGGMRFAFLGGDDDAFAGCEPVCLDDDRRTARRHVGVRDGRLGERPVFRGRDRVPRHERLGKILGAFESGGGARRSENGETRRAEGIDDAGCERRFGAHDRQVHRLSSREGDQRRNRLDRHVGEVAIGRRAGVARRDEDLRHAGRSSRLPCECMFASPTTDNQHIHDVAMLTGTTRGRTGK